MADGNPWDKYSQQEAGPWQKYSQPPPQQESEPSTWEKLTRGYNPDVEKFAEKHPILGPPARFLDAAGGAVAALPQAAYGMVRHPIDTAAGIGESLKDWTKPETWKGAASVLPEALGAGVGNVAAGEAVGSIPRVVGEVGDVKGAVGRATREPGKISELPMGSPTPGKLKPWARTASQVGGASAGALTGGFLGSIAGPEGGGFGVLSGANLGYKLGPSIADSLLPAHPNPIGEVGRIPIRMQTGTIPPVGSAAQEAGYYPPVTKVPIRPTPDYKLTPESVPGPDTAGKGNLLSPLAKRGDARAAAELQRRGRNVLYVPAEEDYPEPRSRQKF